MFVVRSLSNGKISLSQQRPPENEAVVLEEVQPNTSQEDLTNRYANLFGLHNLDFYAQQAEDQFEVVHHAVLHRAANIAVEDEDIFREIE